METQVKFEEWKSSSGNYYVCAKTHIGKLPNQWWFPAHILGISALDFIQLLHDRYNAKVELLNDKQLLYYWNSKESAKAHKFVLDINKEIRKKNIKM